MDYFHSKQVIVASMGPPVQAAAITQVIIHLLHAVERVDYICNIVVDDQSEVGGAERRKIDIR